MASSPVSLMAVAREIATQHPNASDTASAEAAPAAQPGRKKRVRNFTPDDRAAHRVFEKSRREAFRDKLIELASLLPTLSDTDPNRLSKHAVVIASIDCHREQLQLIEELQQERDRLLREVNRLRHATNQCTCQGQTNPLLGLDMQELDSVQEFGLHGDLNRGEDESASFFMHRQTSSGARMDRAPPDIPDAGNPNAAYEDQLELRAQSSGFGPAPGFPDENLVLLRGIEPELVSQAARPVVSSLGPVVIPGQPRSPMDTILQPGDRFGDQWEVEPTQGQEFWQARPNTVQASRQTQSRLEQEPWLLEVNAGVSDALPLGMDVDLSSAQAGPLLDARFDTTASLLPAPLDETRILAYTNCVGAPQFEDFQPVPDQVVW